MGELIHFILGQRDVWVASQVVGDGARKMDAVAARLEFKNFRRIADSLFAPIVDHAGMTADEIDSLNEMPAVGVDQQVNLRTREFVIFVVGWIFGVDRPQFFGLDDPLITDGDFPGREELRETELR